MSYYIPDDYVTRDAVQDFEGEAKMQGGYQNEVYQEARALADAHDLKTVLDIGAGSGFKLMKYFKDRSTMGVDLPPAVQMLRDKYPDRAWVTIDGVTLNFLAGFDLIICSDVIEHVTDPDALCNLIKSVDDAKYAVISTPDRQILTDLGLQPELGPPRNTCHVREWTFAEFGEYMRSHFNVEKHFYSNQAQCTQCVVVNLCR